MDIALTVYLVGILFFIFFAWGRMGKDIIKTLIVAIAWPLFIGAGAIGGIIVVFLEFMSGVNLEE